MYVQLTVCRFFFLFFFLFFLNLNLFVLWDYLCLFFIFKFIYFIYLFLAALDLWCGARASHRSGFSCCGAWALGTRAQ